MTVVLVSVLNDDGNCSAVLEHTNNRAYWKAMHSSTEAKKVARDAAGITRMPYEWLQRQISSWIPHMPSLQGHGVACGHTKNESFRSKQTSLQGTSSKTFLSTQRSYSTSPILDAKMPSCSGTNNQWSQHQLRRTQNPA